MIPLSKMVIRLKAEVELREGSILFGFEEVKLRIGYWKIVDRLDDKVKMRELHTGEVRQISYGMLGKLVTTPTEAINFTSEDAVPSMIDM